MVTKQAHRAKNLKEEEEEENRQSRSFQERLEYLSILGRFCVSAGTPVEIEKCTSSKTERDTKIAELMTTAPPTKPNTNSSMHPGFMALCWHGETSEAGGLHGGQRGIFVVRICHSAAATKTMPSAAAFHSILQRLPSDDVTSLSPPHNHRAAAPSFYAATQRTASLLTTFLSSKSLGLAHWLQYLEDLHNLFTRLHQTDGWLILSSLPLCNRKDQLYERNQKFSAYPQTGKFQTYSDFPPRIKKIIKILQYVIYKVHNLTF